MKTFFKELLKNIPLKYNKNGTYKIKMLSYVIPKK